MFDNNYTLLMILNQQLNRDKMIRNKGDIPRISHFWHSSRLSWKYIPQETPLGNWKALSRMEKKVCERQFQYLQLLSIEYWRHVKTGNNPSFRNNRGRQTCADENEFSIFCFHKIQVSQTPVINSLGSALECLGKKSHIFSKSWFHFEISRIFQKWGRSSWLVT